MVKVAYILAASHSGSTLLSMLLGAHPQIATVGELRLSPQAMGNLARYRCSCGEFIRDCKFWLKVREDMALKGVDFDLARAGTDYTMAESRYVRRLLGPLHRGWFLEGLRDAALDLSGTWRRQLRETHRRSAALVSVICRIRNAAIAVDSSKIARQLKYLLRNPDLEVRVIRLVRDGRAVTLTYMDTANFADARDPTKRAGGTGGDRARQHLSLSQAAYEWRRCMEEAEHVLRSLPRSQWIEVHYEDYCDNPDAVLNKLHSFLDVEPSGQPKDFRTVGQHVIGNGMRLDITSEVRRDDRWRQVLSAQDLRMFDNVAGEMNRRYGYQ